MKTSFIIILLDTAVTESVKRACGSILDIRFAGVDFLDFNNSVNCESGSTLVEKKDSIDNKIIREGNDCTAGYKKMTHIGEKCSRFTQMHW